MAYFANPSFKDEKSPYWMGGRMFPIGGQTCIYCSWWVLFNR